MPMITAASGIVKVLRVIDSGAMVLEGFMTEACSWQVIRSVTATSGLHRDLRGEDRGTTKSSETQSLIRGANIDSMTWAAMTTRRPRRTQGTSPFLTCSYNVDLPTPTMTAASGMVKVRRVMGSGAMVVGVFMMPHLLGCESADGLDFVEGDWA